MKVEVDFIKGLIYEMTFEQVKELMEESQMSGYEQGVKDGKASVPIINVPRPVITKVADKPKTRPTLPKNNKVMLEKFLNGEILKDEKALVEVDIAETWYKRGHQDGFNGARNNEPPKFDPKLHVDNSLYGYASTLELQKLNTPNGHSTILRDKNKWSKDADLTFVKITSIGEGK